MSQTTVKVRPRRGTKSEWESANPILLDGELAIQIPNNGIGSGDIKIKIGDGVTEWNKLPYGIDGDEAGSIHAGTVSDHKDLCIRTGTHTEWMESDPVLQKGEIVYDTTNGEIKIGDGYHAFSDLRYVGETWDYDVIYDFGDYDNADDL